MSGLCAAMASARQGARTALIQDRSVFGGNASSEMKMHISGASCHWGKKDAAETGILMELQLENKYLNDSYNYSIWDGVLWSAAKDCENLDIYMNTTMDEVDSDGSMIRKIGCCLLYTSSKAVYRDLSDSPSEASVRLPSPIPLTNGCTLPSASFLSYLPIYLKFRKNPKLVTAAFFICASPARVYSVFNSLQTTSKYCSK